jgi:hypothetical protein
MRRRFRHPLPGFGLLWEGCPEFAARTPGFIPSSRAAGLQAGGQKKLKFSRGAEVRAGLAYTRGACAPPNDGSLSTRSEEGSTESRPSNREWGGEKGGAGTDIRIERGPMKKLIPFVLGVWVIALVGCTTAPSTTTTTTTTRQTNASLDPTLSNSRTTMPSRGGPR